MTFEYPVRVHETTGGWAVELTWPDADGTSSLAGMHVADSEESAESYATLVRHIVDRWRTDQNIREVSNDRACMVPPSEMK